MRKILWRLALILGCAILVLALAGYWYLFVIPVTVINQSHQTLSNVEIDLGGRILRMGTLGVEQSHKAYGTIKQEGLISISFDSDGRTIHHKLDYVTSGLGDGYVIKVQSPEKITFDYAQNGLVK